MLNKVLSLSPETALRRTPEPVLLDACFKFAHDDDQPNHLQMGQRQYRIGKQIAKVTAGGGVYSAFEKDLGPVAIKAMVTRTNEQESTANREIAFLQFLGENPYTVTLFDAGKSEKDTIYAVMSLSKEGSLRNFLDHLPETGTELPKQAVIPLLLQIAKALEYCHEKKVIHHDLKPENILFFKHTLLLCDFGTAQYTGSENARAMTGTLPYIAPEIVQEAEIGDPAKIDIWALGLILLELVGHPCPISDDAASGIGHTLMTLGSGAYNLKIDAHLASHLKTWWAPLATQLLCANNDNRLSATETIRELEGPLSKKRRKS